MAPGSLGRRKQLEFTLPRVFQTPEARVFLEARNEDPPPRSTHTHILCLSPTGRGPGLGPALPGVCARGAPPTPGGTSSRGSRGSSEGLSSRAPRQREPRKGLLQKPEEGARRWEQPLGVARALSPDVCAPHRELGAKGPRAGRDPVASLGSSRRQRDAPPPPGLPPRPRETPPRPQPFLPAQLPREAIGPGGGRRRRAALSLGRTFATRSLAPRGCCALTLRIVAGLAGPGSGARCTGRPLAKGRRGARCRPRPHTRAPRPASGRRPRRGRGAGSGDLPAPGTVWRWGVPTSPGRFPAPSRPAEELEAGARRAAAPSSERESAGVERCHRPLG